MNGLLGMSLDPGANSNSTDGVKATDPSLCGRVLIVEDNRVNQMVIGRMLQKAGLTIEYADNGRIGFEKVLSERAEGRLYDIVMMDMQMPEMDGYEATRRLREEGITLPIIAVTAHAMTGDREKCIDAGCDDYMTKPVDREAMLAMVARYLNQGDLRQAG